MEKSMKVIIMIMSIVMIFAVASTAFAYDPDPFTGNAWNQSKFGVLRNGSERNSVFGCQRCVNVSADGIFGSGTESAVKAYQRAHSGLSVDGVVGTGTWTAFRNDLIIGDLTNTSAGYRLYSGGPIVFAHYSDGRWTTWTRHSVEVVMGS